MCLLLEDISSQMLYDISGGLGIDMSADRGVMMGDLVDQCLSFKNGSSSNSTLGDIAYSRDPVTDERVFLGDVLLRDLRDPLAQSFDEVATALARQNETRAHMSSMMFTLRDTLA